MSALKTLNMNSLPMITGDTDQYRELETAVRSAINELKRHDLYKQDYASLLICELFQAAIEFKLCGPCDDLRDTLADLAADLSFQLHQNRN